MISAQLGKDSLPDAWAGGGISDYSSGQIEMPARYCRITAVISVCQSLRSYGYFPFNPRTPEQGDMQRSPVKREWLQNQRFSTELSKFCLCNGFRKSGALRPPHRNCRTSESGWLEGAGEAFGGVCARVPG